MKSLFTWELSLLSLVGGEIDEVIWIVKSRNAY